MPLQEKDWKHELAKLLSTLNRLAQVLSAHIENEIKKGKAVP